MQTHCLLYVVMRVIVKLFKVIISLNMQGTVFEVDLSNVEDLIRRASNIEEPDE